MGVTSRVRRASCVARVDPCGDAGSPLPSRRCPPGSPTLEQLGLSRRRPRSSPAAASNFSQPARRPSSPGQAAAPRRARRAGAGRVLRAGRRVPRSRGACGSRAVAEGAGAWQRELAGGIRDWEVALYALIVLRYTTCWWTMRGSETRRRAPDTAGVRDERRHIHEISPMSRLDSVPAERAETLCPSFDRRSRVQESHRPGLLRSA